jgi:hypothetical protein
MAKVRDKANTRRLIAHADEIPDVRILPVADVHINPDNPKKPLSADRKKGLNTNLDKFGMCSAILVAPHPDFPGEFIILDGNTRYEEMVKRGHDKIPVQVLNHIKTPEDIKEFVITYDRNVKAYNEDLVEQQLRDLVDKGEDVEMLSKLSNIDNLEDLLNGDADSVAKTFVDTAGVDEQDTLLLTGPKISIDAIKASLKKIKGKIDTATKARKILEACEGFDYDDDDSILLALLIASAQMSKADTKVVIPFVSQDQKNVVFSKIKEFIEQEGITGDYAISRAIEYLCVDH